MCIYLSIYLSIHNDNSISSEDGELILVTIGTVIVTVMTVMLMEGARIREAGTKGDAKWR